MFYLELEAMNRHSTFLLVKESNLGFLVAKSTITVLLNSEIFSIFSSLLIRLSSLLITVISTSSSLSPFLKLSDGF